MSENRFLDAALRYAAHGIVVVPTIAGSKIPHTDDENKRLDLSDPDAIKHWWSRWPTAEISIACGEISGIDVLDVDHQHGGFASLERYEAEYGAVPRDAVQRTPSGGLHIWFKHRDGLKSWSGGQKTAPRGLDRRGSGAIAKVAPSKGYRWIRLVPPADLPPWPEALAALYTPVEPPAPRQGHRRPLVGREADWAARYVEAVIEDYVARISALQPGCQRDELNRLCWSAGGFLEAAPKISPEETYQRLVTAGLGITNQPGRPRWTRSRIEKIVGDALRAGRKAGPATIPDFKPPKRRRRR